MVPLTEMKVHQAIDRLVAAGANLATIGSHKIHRELGLKGSLATVVKYMRTYPGHPSSPPLPIAADIAAGVARAIADALETMAQEIASAKAEMMLEIANLAKQLEDATLRERAAATEISRLSDEAETLRRELRLVATQFDNEATIAKNYRDAERAGATAAIVQANLAKPDRRPQ